MERIQRKINYYRHELDAILCNTSNEQLTKAHQELAGYEPRYKIKKYPILKTVLGSIRWMEPEDEVIAVLMLDMGIKKRLNVPESSLSGQ